MKRLLIVFIVFNIVLSLSAWSISISAESEKNDTGKISGVWVANNFHYSFDENGIMKAVHIDSEPVSYETYRYEMFAMGDHNFIRYGKDLSDNASIEFLFVSNVTDSTALFAYGMPFIRGDTSMGLLGLWKHVEDVTIVQWNIGEATIDYSQVVLDLNTGEFKTVEERHGTYIRARRRYDAGRFYIDFQDGKKAVVLPIIYKDIMYMFDLSPRNSLFTATENIPSYKDYKAALK